MVLSLVNVGPEGNATAGHPALWCFLVGVSSAPEERAELHQLVNVKPRGPVGIQRDFHTAIYSLQFCLGFAVAVPGFGS